MIFWAIFDDCDFTKSSTVYIVKRIFSCYVSFSTKHVTPQCQQKRPITFAHPWKHLLILENRCRNTKHTAQIFSENTQRICNHSILTACLSTYKLANKVSASTSSGGVKVHTLLYGFFTVVTSTTMHPYPSTLSMPLGKLRTATIVKSSKFRFCLENIFYCFPSLWRFFYPQLQHNDIEWDGKLLPSYWIKMSPFCFKYKIWLPFWCCSMYVWKPSL